MMTVEQVRTLTGHTDGVNSVAVTPDVTDRIGVLAYILNFFFSWSGPLAKICICEKCPTYIETGMCSGLSSPFRWKCPTYVGTGAYKHTFCVIGKSNIIKMDKGCLCLTCPVQKNLDLRWERYYLKGSGKEQSEMK